MYFNREGDFRIEMTPAAPLPSGFADQGRQMVGGVRAGLFYRLVAFFNDQIPGAMRVCRGAEQVQIVLRPQAWVRNKVRRLCRALQEDVLDAGGGEPLAHLILQSAGTFQTLRVLCQVLRDAFADPTRQGVTRHCAEDERQ